MAQHEVRIRNGMKAYQLLEELRGGNTDPAVRAEFNKTKQDLGYGMLLKRYTPNVTDATEAQIQLATGLHSARGAAVLRLPHHGGLWRDHAVDHRPVVLERDPRPHRPEKWLHRAALYGLPLPWIAIESGWFVAEYGRQPWAIGEVLPTAVANSSLTAGDILFSMGLICGLYTLFLVAELYLMFKFARLGPSSLKTGRYHFEQPTAAVQEAR